MIDNDIKMVKSQVVIYRLQLFFKAKTCHWCEFAVELKLFIIIRNIAILVCKIQRKQELETLTPVLKINYQELFLG